MARKAKAGKLSMEDWNLLPNLKRRIKSRIRASIKSRGQQVISKDDPKETWKFVRKMTFTQSKGNNYLPDIDHINSFFAELVKPDSLQSTSELSPFINDILSSDEDRDVLFDIHPLDCGTTEKLLSKVKANSATGSDDIPAFLVKKLAHYISPNITLLYNSSIQNGIFPDQWKKASDCYIQEQRLQIRCRELQTDLCTAYAWESS